MALQMQQRQLRSSAVAPFSSTRIVVRRVCRRPNVQVQALFGLFNKPSAAAPPGRAADLVDELFALTRNTNAGAALSQQKREQLRDLIDELKNYCPKNPLRSNLLWGEYEVLYAFAVDSVGGPFRKGAGPILFPGQKPSQILEQPNVIVNRLDFKTLGFLPGYGQQTGTFRPLNADTFELNLTERQASVGFGESVAEISFVRKIQILYLDERCRVARFIPDAVEGSDEEPRDDAFFVFERVVEQEQEEKAPAAQSPKAAAPKAAAPKVEGPKAGTTMVPLFGSSGRQPGLATMAERKVRQQMEAQAAKAQAGSGTAVAKKSGGTGIVQLPRPVGGGTGLFRLGGQSATAEPAAAGKTTAGKAAAGRAAAGKAAAAPKADPRAAAAEKRRAEAAKARQREEQERAKAKAAAEQEKARKEAEARAAKERAEAEKAARAQKLAAVKEALNKLGAELQAAQVESRQAKVELRDVEKQGQATLRTTAQARQQLEAAVGRVQAATEQLQSAASTRNSAQAALKEAQAALRETEKQVAARR